MIVRHEYAHYMCHSIYRCMDHSFLYEKCAKHIGCNDRVVYAFLAKNGIQQHNGGIYHEKDYFNSRLSGNYSYCFNRMCKQGSNYR